MILELDSIKKTINKKVILDDINLSIEHSPILAILGNDDEEKSTLLKIIDGIYSCNSGSVKINDNEVNGNFEFRKNIFYVSNDPYFIENENIEYILRTYKMFYKDFNIGFAIDEIEKIFDLNTTYPSKLSSPNRRVIAIICALASESKYILIDKTLDGIEGPILNDLKKLILKENSNKGTTLLINTSNIKEIDDIVSDFIVLSDNSLKFHKNINEENEYISKVTYFDESMRNPDEIFESNDIISFVDNKLTKTVIVKLSKDKNEQYIKNKDIKYFDIKQVYASEIYDNLLKYE